MSTKQLASRIEQLETARPAADEDLTITPDMDPAEALRRYRRSLDAPSRKPTAEEQARQREQEADPDYAELCTRVYRLSFDHDLTGDQLFELAKQQLADERAAQAAAAERAEAEQEATRIYRESLLEDPSDDNPLSGLSAEDAVQRYREQLDEPAPVVDQQPTGETAIDEQPEPTPTPQAVQLAGQPDDDSDWMLL